MNWTNLIIWFINLKRISELFTYIFKIFDAHHRWFWRSIVRAIINFYRQLCEVRFNQVIFTRFSHIYQFFRKFLHVSSFNHKTSCTWKNLQNYEFRNTLYIFHRCITSWKFLSSDWLIISLDQSKCSSLIPVMTRLLFQNVTNIISKRDLLLHAIFIKTFLYVWVSKIFTKIMKKKCL